MAQTACRSLTRALRSPGLLPMRASRASGSMLLASASRTRCATRLRCSFPALLKLTISAFLSNLSLFRLQFLFLPHSLIGSLQVIMTGCWVISSRLRSSALPPESPLRTVANSSGIIDSSILSSDTLENPPLRWSTSSSSIMVLPLVTPPPEN